MNTQDPKDYKGEEEFYSRQDKLDVKRPIWRRYLWQLIACIALLLVVVFATTTIYLLANRAPGTTVVTLPQTATATPTVPTQIPPTPTPSPTSTSSPTPTPSPTPTLITITKNLDIPCISCGLKLDIKLTTIVIDTTKQTSTWSFTLTNNGNSIQSLYFSTLVLEDNTGQKHQGGGLASTDRWNMSNGQS